MGFREAVELGVATFVGVPPTDVGQVYDRLVMIGVEDWLAARLAHWLPSAAARRLFPELQFCETYSEAGATKLLREDPVFVAVCERVELASRGEIGCMVPVSSEAAAARALDPEGDREGSNAAVAPAESLPPVSAGDGGVPEPRAAFARMLWGHGHQVTKQPNGAFVLGDLVIDAHVFPAVTEQGVRAQVDFEVRHPALANGVLYESFAGIGATYGAAMRDAVEKFQRGSVHVIIAALLDRSSCAGQVTWERWAHPQGSLEICVGSQLVFGEREAPMAELLDGLFAALANEPAGPGLHTLRLYTMRAGTRVFCDEVLLDGEPWQAGLSLCTTYEWPDREPAWGTRLFAMFRTGGE